MKTFQFASIVAGLSFLKTTIAAGDGYITLGMGSIHKNDIYRVAEHMWTIDAYSVPSNNHGSYPIFGEEINGSVTRIFPIVYNGDDWRSGDFYYSVESTEDLSYIKLRYNGARYETCMVSSPE
ncbi:CSEP0372 putative effector protein [Blumeria hordei DH14]|uniref:CSEP0372 putative effector protein n=1 Tax=Blumeria graminis f. sp. hordei (strain DH14) TaxID=546991 RepID=N1JFM8_BLUG1|nr:CSEP0372 putative effector protein [Blumeria hordei DH14]